jgi:hypothetical protein
MKPKLLFIHLLLSIGIAAQNIQLSSFQQTERWISQANFPHYTSDKTFSDSILAYAGEALRKKLNATNVVLPSQIDYDYITMFGKPKIKNPSGAGNDFQVSILSFITRATAGYAIEWHMQAEIQQSGKNILSRKTEHELEYFAVDGYMRPVAWMGQEEFLTRMKAMIDELLETGERLPDKIIVGSYKQIEGEVMKIMPAAMPYTMKTGGSFLNGGNFIMSLQKDQDTITTVSYHDGWDASSSPLINTSKVAADFFKSVTGIDMAYKYKSKEKRFGRAEYSNGRKLKLRMEWTEEKDMYTDNTTGEKYYRSPMVAEMYEGDELTGYFGFQQKPGEIFGQGISELDGKIKDLPVHLEYDPQTAFLKLTTNDSVRMVMVILNMNPDSRSAAGEKLSKNKKFITESSGFKPQFKNSEWYHLYYTPSVSDEEMREYMDAVLCLFFGIGNSK